MRKQEKLRVVRVVTRNMLGWLRLAWAVVSQKFCQKEFLPTTMVVRLVINLTSVVSLAMGYVMALALSW